MPDDPAGDHDGGEDQAAEHDAAHDPRPFAQIRCSEALLRKAGEHPDRQRRDRTGTALGDPRLVPNGLRRRLNPIHHLEIGANGRGSLAAYRA